MSIKDYEIVKIIHLELYCDDELICSWDEKDLYVGEEEEK